jgi:CBS-domain-containing membrane protein
MDIMDYFKKMRGNAASPPQVSLEEVFWSWLGAFLGIAAVALLHYRLLSGSGLMMLIGSFGASAVLIYGAIASPLAQPRNLLGGHLISGLIGVTSYQLIPDLWLASAVAVATAIAAMHLSKTLHPPGGATALIAVIGGADIHNLGYLYALVPAASGAGIMLLIALLVNNIPKSRKYPVFWW